MKFFSVLNQIKIKKRRLKMKWTVFVYIKIDGYFWLLLTKQWSDNFEWRKKKYLTIWYTQWQVL